MEPAESSPADEFVSGQNLRFGIAEPPRCDSSVLAGATQRFKLMRSQSVLLHQQARLRCVKVQGERGKCGSPKQELGSKRGTTGW